MTATDTKVVISYKLVEVEDNGISEGDQIAVKRLYKDLHPAMAFLYPAVSPESDSYFHHGVYLDEKDKKVAHFYGENKANAKPQSCGILRFINGAVQGKLYRVDYDNLDLVRSEKDTLRRANEAIENPGRWPEYHIFNNNCESFATWLKTGVMKSAQAIAAITKIVELASTVAAVAGSIGAGIGASR